MWSNGIRSIEHAQIFPSPFPNKRLGRRHDTLGVNWRIHWNMISPRPGVLHRRAQENWWLPQEGSGIGAARHLREFLIAQLDALGLQSGILMERWCCCHRFNRLPKGRRLGSPWQNRMARNPPADLNAQFQTARADEPIGQAWNNSPQNRFSDKKGGLAKASP
jgi:hypothetical protein